MAKRPSEARLLVDFLYRLHASPATVEQEVVDELRCLIRCDVATYREIGEEFVEVTSGVDLTEARMVWRTYYEFRDEDPLPGVDYTPNARYGAAPGVATRLSDVVDDRAFRQTGFFSQLCRPLGTRHIVKLFVEAPSATAGIVLESASHDFSDRDVDVLTSLAPHFQLARRRHRHCGEPVDRIMQVLTAREQEVVRLVATGMTNRQIAAVLFVSTGTVRKHLDNIYAKTGTPNRTALAGAVTRG